MAHPTSRTTLLLPTARGGAALLAAVALAGAAPRTAPAQAVGGARVPMRTPCTSAAPVREQLRMSAPPDEEMRRRVLELRAARLAAAGASAGGAAAAPRGQRFEMVQITPRGYLGLRMLEVSDVRESAAGRVVRYCQYPVVLSVVPESPADRAGLLEGDTLIAYNDRDLVQSGEIELDRLLVPGETVRVALRRDGRALTRPVVVGRQQMNVVRLWTGDRDEMVLLGPPGAVVARPSTGRAVVAPRARVPAPSGEATVTVPAIAPNAMGPTPPAFIYFGTMAGGPTPLAGAQFLSLDDDLREALGARSGAGVVVVRVLPESPAAAFGLRSGDVIRTAAGQVVTSPTQFQRVLAAARAAAAAEEPVQLEVERRGQRKTIALKW